ncbi:IS4 family transposase [uncultured Oscillibacter sp.]|uniref:IS4 family transposase n=1 Tax=uncultured Oscillibacter sp. TaxID=876091 RepID=UPI0026025552|nr:IS4 family transposase [uncultured Oscillibacter sp.]
MLIGRFQNSEKTPSASAFVQQRQKLLPAALETLFHRFTALLRPGKTFRGYRLLAVDGSSLKSAACPEDPASYRPGTSRQHGWNLWHMNALFDLENGIYTDLIVQKEHEKNECRALCQMADRSRVSGKVILLADRNYESCNNLAHLEKRNWNYLIRIRDKARGIAYGMPLPDQLEFDIPLKLTLGRLTPRQLETRGIAVPKSYYRIPPTMTFDFLESNSPDFYEISFRVVRLQTDSGNTETLITNLDPDRFPLTALKALYARRWGIETSFRSLKYAVGLIHLHAKKPDLVLQEVFASFLIFNFSQAAAWAVDASQGTAKYKRHVNFSDAVFACCAFLRRSAADPLPLLRRRLLPLRLGRTAPRPKITGNRISACYASAR